MDSSHVMSGRGNAPQRMEDRWEDHEVREAEQTLECVKLAQSVALFTFFVYSVYSLSWAAYPINVIVWIPLASVASGAVSNTRQANLCAMVTIAPVVLPRGGRHGAAGRLVMFIVGDGIGIGLQVASLVYLLILGHSSRCTSQSEGKFRNSGEGFVTD